MEMPTRDSIKRTICRIGRDGRGYCERSGPDGTARIPVIRGDGGAIFTGKGEPEGSRDALLRLYRDLHRGNVKVQDSD